MRLVIAILRPTQVESVRQALAAVEVTRLTLADGQGFLPGGQTGPVQETMLQIACNDDFVERALQAIAGVLTTAGEEPTGRLFTLPLADAVQLYRAVRGPEAV